MSRSHLGQGLAFPFRFSRQTGGAELSAVTTREHEHIHESIRQILGTRLGERFMRPGFGSKLHTLVFEQNADVLKGLLRFHVTDALKRWERRITVLEVTFDSSEFARDQNTIGVRIRYRLIASQIEGNYVYPFTREGSPA